MTLEELKKQIELEVNRGEENVSIIDLVNYLLIFGYKSGASDIHFQPTEHGINVRYRIDGILYTFFNFPKYIQEEMIARIKVIAGLRTDEHNAPQDGRFKFKIPQENINFDIRVSIMPTYYGENSVLRLLVQKEEIFILEKLGFSDNDLKKVQEAIKKPYGMILVTGPTGSGKTTTLYSILKALNTPGVSIITLEDPIEYSIAGITQIQVNPQVGLVFSKGLRAILRQDPNIIMVGEIRDQETADIAVNAALTGHLLLSTLHTNDAPTALPRLLEMGIEPFLISSTVNIVIAQRLVRKLCDHCKQEDRLTSTEAKSLLEGINEDLTLENIKKIKTYKIYKAQGCENCNQTGFKGRIGIFEILEMSKKIKEAIMKRENSEHIKKIALSEGMSTMIRDGFNKVINGLTTIEEVLRVIHE
ncbi:MAG: GspE/PulE family protein [Patescibacteria group bacterium]|nr:GspE/PulE family protein [Patescibacteria group bacterium]